jgi:hypothetical protein
MLNNSNLRNEIKREDIIKAKITRERDSNAAKYKDMKQKVTFYHNKFVQTEKASTQLKERLQKALNDKGIKKSGLGIINTLQKNTVNQDVLKSSIIQSLEEENGNLCQENEDLRESMKKLDHEMTEIRAYFEGKTVFDHKVRPGMFELPFEKVKIPLEEYFQEKIESIRELIEMDQQNEILLDEVMERLDEESLAYFTQLQQKVEDQYAIIQEQDNLLQHCMNEMKDKDDYFSDLTQSFTENLFEFPF